jgi:hypothetical protein
MRITVNIKENVSSIYDDKIFNEFLCIYSSLWVSQSNKYQLSDKWIKNI